MKGLFRLTSLVLALTVLVTLATSVTYAAPDQQPTRSIEDAIDAFQSNGVPELSSLAESAQRFRDTGHGVIEFSKLPVCTFGEFDPPLVAHESVHAQDFFRFTLRFGEAFAVISTGCLTTERNAFAVGALAWSVLEPDVATRIKQQTLDVRSLSPISQAMLSDDSIVLSNVQLFLRISNEAALEQILQSRDYEINCGASSGVSPSPFNGANASTTSTSQRLSNQTNSSATTQLGDPSASPQHLPQTGGIPPMVLPTIAIALLGVGAGLRKLARRWVTQTADLALSLAAARGTVLPNRQLPSRFTPSWGMDWRSTSCTGPPSPINGGQRRSLGGIS